MRPMGDTTADKLLDLAQELIQTRGYNAFSYRDLADRVGIKTASIHYHFATKGDLGLALVARHRKGLAATLADIDRHAADPPDRLRRFVALFRATLADGDRMCLCGMLAAEYRTLPPPVAAEVRLYFEDNERWLARTLLAGRKSGELAFADSAAVVARAAVASLEGAMLAARLYADRGRFDAAAAWLLANLGA